MAAKRVLLLCGDYMEDYEALQAYGVSMDAACPDQKAGDACCTAVHQPTGHQVCAGHCCCWCCCCCCYWWCSWLLMLFLEYCCCCGCYYRESLSTHQIELPLELSCCWN